MASGATLDTFGALDGVAPASNFATIDSRNAHPVLDFDATTEEAIYFESVLPRNYGGGGLTAYIHWMATTATSNSVVWGASIERHAESGDDLDADSFASEQTASEACDGTSGKVQITAITTLTHGANIDNVAVGESYRLRIARKVQDASDTMAGDAEILKVELKET